MRRFDHLRFELAETLDRRSPENRSFLASDLMARYRIANDGREIIGASIWEELVTELTDLSAETTPLPESQHEDTCAGRCGFAVA